MTATADRRPLADRARPQRLADLAGNARVLAAFRSWGVAWTGPQPPRQRAALLEGPPGTGKTSAALALAQEMGWEVVEMNASDARNQSAIDLVAGRAAITRTLSAEPTASHPRTLILLDEADCLTGRATEGAAERKRPAATFREFLRTRYGSLEALALAWKLDAKSRPPAFTDWEEVPATGGRGAWTRLAPAQKDLSDWRESVQPRDSSDRGGMGAIARLVRTTRQPLVLTVNDPRPLTRYSPVFRSAVARFGFDRLADREVAEAVRRVARREGLRLGSDAVEAIVRRAGGDLRAALNDVEAVSAVAPGPLQLGLLGTRDRTDEFGEFVEVTFARPRLWRSTEVQGVLDAVPDDLLPWVEENAPRFARTPDGRLAGVRTAAVADRLLSLARRWRVYGLWSYASEVMAGAVPLEVEHAGGVRVGRAGFPMFLGEMGRSRTLRAVRNGLSLKVGRHGHLSRRKSRLDALPFLEALFDPARAKGRGPLCRRLVRELGLSAEEVALLLGQAPESPAVVALLPAAELQEATGPEAPAASPPATASLPTEPPAAPAKKTRVQRSLGEF